MIRRYVAYLKTGGIVVDIFEVDDKSELLESRMNAPNVTIIQTTEGDYGHTYDEKNKKFIKSEIDPITPQPPIEKPVTMEELAKQQKQMMDTITWIGQYGGLPLV